MLIILDRDGVINEDRVDYVKNLNEFKLIQGSLEAIVKLKQAGHKLAIATNQSGIGRGYYSEATLQAMHHYLQTELKKRQAEIDWIVYCPHLPEEKCECRKPKPGMYIKIANHFSMDLTQAIVIGDTLRDVEAAIAVGAKPILVKSGKGQQHQKIYELLKDVPCYENLAEAAEIILKTNH